MMTHDPRDPLADKWNQMDALEKPTILRDHAPPQWVHTFTITNESPEHFGDLWFEFESSAGHKLEKRWETIAAHSRLEPFTVPHDPPDATGFEGTFNQHDHGGIEVVEAPRWWDAYLCYYDKATFVERRRRAMTRRNHHRRRRPSANPMTSANAERGNRASVSPCMCLGHGRGTCRHRQMRSCLSASLRDRSGDDYSSRSSKVSSKSVSWIVPPLFDSSSWWCQKCGLSTVSVMTLTAPVVLFRQR
jgi:hypothetical protein